MLILMVLPPHVAIGTDRFGIVSVGVAGGYEFTSRHFDSWAHQRGIKLDYIAPGRPVENCYIESFNGKFRDECLSENWFDGLVSARLIIEEWRLDYNKNRPHSSLDNLAPEQFLARIIGL